MASHQLHFDLNENGDTTTNNHNHNHHHVPNKKPKISLISDAELRTEFAHHDQTVARINNGSFGSCPASIIAAQQQWQLKFLRQPDAFYINHLKPSILRTRTVIKDLINADDVDEVSIVDNATTAAAIVLQQTSRAFAEGKFQKGDAAVMLHYAYGAVKKSMEAYVARSGGHVIRSPIALPLKELVKICRDEGVDQVFVDAAHAIGCTEVDMKEIGADFYTSNLHKWFFCPPAVAFLYCRKSDEQSDLHHPVVSHEYGNGLAVESAWIGTRDYSAQIVVPEVVEFVNRFEGGIDGIRKRNHDKVVEMAEMLVKAWGTHLGAPPGMCASMVMVGLPTCLGILSDSDALKLRTHLRDCYGIEVPIYYRAPKHEEVNPITGLQLRSGLVCVVFTINNDHAIDICKLNHIFLSLRASVLIILAPWDFGKQWTTSNRLSMGCCGSSKRVIKGEKEEDRNVTGSSTSLYHSESISHLLSQHLWVSISRPFA
ncbi:hypothetical protein F0562_020095 [Nyssa sinensis]|uniref:Aminotransferase class V domain-containing protein n=1 Tax=Nyssa sinensis TaxID=561372 RepID=A0A5J5BVJ8_9ASTE|nr:hypothetical protein F0562_020095 [Nyssa sinensis]